ncbi:MAG: TetR/AcrR family transcriptional regulator [Clostridia bacterium]|nr:TetR/AcrR family transcriptional regulator [Clostridia bacterium]
MARRHGEYASVREAILATASSLFLQGGVHAVSLQDIAAAADLSKGTLYYYYPTKDSLVMELAHNNTETVTDTLFAWVDSLSRGDDMHAAVLRLLDAITAEDQLGGLHIVLCAEAAMGNATLRELLNAAYREWTVMFEVGALKVQSKNAAAIRAKSGLFFTVLLGYVLQRQSGIGDPAKDVLADFFMP